MGERGVCENIKVSVCFTPARVIRSRRSQVTGPPLHVVCSSSGHFPPPGALNHDAKQVEGFKKKTHPLLPPITTVNRVLTPSGGAGGVLTFGQSHPPQSRK
jgi:hypothetical protein